MYIRVHSHRADFDRNPVASAHKELPLTISFSTTANVFLQRDDRVPRELSPHCPKETQPRPGLLIQVTACAVTCSPHWCPAGSYLPNPGPCLAPGSSRKICRVTPQQPVLGRTMAREETLLLPDCALEHSLGKIQSHVLQGQNPTVPGYHIRQLMSGTYWPLEKLLHILKVKQGVTDWEAAPGLLNAET